eukprot:TRINITY_DN1470_c2_g1_i3.p1 TRINITY_DN1470_c2_g1~~TRINITY_DN1470_c2_g1_i3.p1  ORF type:complete len:125 (+),score=26.55 TRINITY_DN1470_c2_g1_i3:140-514(+)
MSNHEQVGKAFVDYYYKTFATNRSGLAPIYRPESMLTFEGQPIQGAEPIVKKLTELSFGQAKHQIDTLDCQPSPGQGVLVFVSGLLITEGQDHPIRFSEVFNLQPIPGTNGFYVLNHLFRLCYG